ncbi:AAA-like domain-containing protein [Laspinema olomoucense]|uniref:AAA-like domain-containing protein n=1 Tax=Laspinema olomoucense D3b TaxID=2953688 RepID=A0ABT2N2D8_9CYAN|nr:AAA-like domain-containing protein [Laspinema sp. D3b]MCT7976858.1 AAA-like domain-containing protein [Laspinema sp. D3b]
MGSSFYRSEGGGLEPKAPSYVRREADDRLLEFVRNERSSCGVCYILAPRQSGKTSLMNQTASQLRNQDIICLQLSLQELGNFDSEVKFYFNLLRRICQELDKFAGFPIKGTGGNLIKALDRVWYANQDVQPGLKFKEFLNTEILVPFDKKLVIFIDEIQSLIAWQLQNTFIGFLKSLSETRNEPALKQLAFVLLGVAKPSDLVTNYIYAFNFGEQIELSYLTGDCEPLQRGLESATTNPARVLKAILSWTGGQPFLTQVLCDLVAKGSAISEDIDVEEYIDTLVEENILDNWRRQDRLNHFHGIENWFRRVNPSQKVSKLASLRIYSRLLASGKRAMKFDGYDPRHWDLLISGIVKKEEDYLALTNGIYKQIFNLNWVNECENYLQEDFMGSAPFATIYNRDVFILIDQSASMTRKDAVTGHQSRYEYLQEIVEGHINSILSETSDPTAKAGEKICDSVSVFFFSRNAVADYPITVRDAAQVQSLFLENKPKTKTFIGPTLERCLDIWLAEGKTKDRGAFFIIYTDGLFDDEPRFEDCLKRACQKIDSEKEVKFVILGLGTDIDVKSFLEIDFNVNNKIPHNIVMFNLVNKLEDDDILLELERQLGDDAGLAFPDWVKEEYPDFVKKVTEAHQKKITEAHQSSGGS